MIAFYCAYNINLLTWTILPIESSILIGSENIKWKDEWFKFCG